MGLANRTMRKTKGWIATILGLILAVAAFIVVGFGILYIVQHLL